MNIFEGSSSKATNQDHSRTEVLKKKSQQSSQFKKTITKDLTYEKLPQ